MLCTVQEVGSVRFGIVTGSCYNRKPQVAKQDGIALPEAPLRGGYLTSVCGHVRVYTLCATIPTCVCLSVFAGWHRARHHLQLDNDKNHDGDNVIIRTIMIILAITTTIITIIIP